MTRYRPSPQALERGQRVPSDELNGAFHAEAHAAPFSRLASAFAANPRSVQQASEAGSGSECWYMIVAGTPV